MGVLSDTVYTLIVWVFIIADLFVATFNNIKRIRHIGISMWWILLLFIPAISIIFMLYLVFKKGIND